MNPPSLNDVINQMRAYRLLNPEQLTAVTRDLAPVLQDVPSLVRDLVQRGWLTPHQGNLLAQGRGHELTAPPTTGEVVAPEETLLDSGARWKLALILGGVFVVIFLIALIASSGKKKQPGLLDPDTEGVAWPSDLRTIPGRTEALREDGRFTVKNEQGKQAVWLEGRLVFSEAVVDRVVVREGSESKDYRGVDEVPRPQREVAQVLHELARREVFGIWSR